MKKFYIAPEVIEIFPKIKIGVLVCNGIDNHIEAENKYARYLIEAQDEAGKYITNPQFTENPVVAGWREAFRQFPTKKGARCSIDAMLKRVFNDGSIGTINPLVDLYNGVSLRYGVPVGGEDIDKFEGDMRLAVADGDEYFVTYGSDKSEPPREGEVIYKDDGGAVCRCFNWRESVRTMLTEETTNAFMIIESVGGAGTENVEDAIAELKKLIEENLGGTVKQYIVTADAPEIVIAE